jgi:ppGpp synthetase/RelA/SpoT-type nucleotidyltranferase
MRIPLFDFIEQTLDYYEMKMPSYQYAEWQLRRVFKEVLKSDGNGFVSLHSRIKTRDSLKEKMLRNRFYLDYHTPEEALDHLHDLIGITMECRFIRNEAQLYDLLLKTFNRNGHGYSQCRVSDDVYLNLHMPQPQTQRNGFTIYRIDGYYTFNHEKINFELQIKSLVHSFWSEIEHEVVYKNPDFVMYDRFNKQMLAAIRDNLDVVDRQLEIMYNEISYESKQAQIGMDEKGFKNFVARSINELVNRKMKKSTGFTTDFKKCSAMLAQYIYVRDFIGGEHNREKMIDYLATLNYLNTMEIDFTEEIEIPDLPETDDSFTNIFRNYFRSVMNTDFEWHVFFIMLLEIQPGNNPEDFDSFIDVLHLLVIQPSWYITKFHSHADGGKQARDLCEEALANAIVRMNRIDIVHEDRLYDCMQLFRTNIDVLDGEYPDQKEFMKHADEIRDEITMQISGIFQS